MKGCGKINETADEGTRVWDYLRGEVQEANELLQLSETGRLFTKPIFKGAAKKFELFLRQTCFHGNGIKFESQKIKRSAGLHCLLVGEREA